MEYVPGGSLADRLDGQAWPPRDAARLVETLARAIHEVHRLGIVHRDLKPANILLSRRRQPQDRRLRPGQVAGRRDRPDAQPVDRRLAQLHGARSRPAAAGRGRARGRRLLPRGDPLRAAHRAGRPFQAATVLETLEQVKSAEPVIPTQLRPKLPRDLVTICLKCLEKEPARRYARPPTSWPRTCAGSGPARRSGRGPSAGRSGSGDGAAASRRSPSWPWRCVAGPGRGGDPVAAGRVAPGEAVRQTQAAPRRTPQSQLEANTAMVQAKDREATARRRAQERFDAAMKAFGEFEAITKDAALLREPRLEGLRARLLRTALGFYRELQASLEEDASPEARSQLSEAYARSPGRSPGSSAFPRRPWRPTGRSLVAGRADGRGLARRPRRAGRPGRAHARIGFTFRTMGRPAEALRSYEQARAIQEALARDDPATARYREVLSWTLLEPRRDPPGAGPSGRGDPPPSPGHRDPRGPRRPRSRQRPATAATWPGPGATWPGPGGLGRSRDGPAAGRAGRRASTRSSSRGDRADAETRWRLARCLDEVGRIRS